MPLRRRHRARPPEPEEPPLPATREALADAAESAGQMHLAAKRAVKALETAERAGVPSGDAAGAELLNMVTRQARQLQGEIDELGRRVGGVRRRLGGEETTPARDLVRDAPLPAAEPGDDAEAEAASPSPGIRLVVNQMVAVGATRLEVEERLRDLGIADAAAVTRSVLDAPEEER